MDIKNEKILKNTIALYVRLILITLISLYTSRIVLKSLGIEDFGLYNVVGGIVTLCSFLMSSMSNSTQRFFSYEMGRSDVQSLMRVFSMSITTHIIIVIFVLILAETIGLWFLNSQIQIPEGREFAANCIYQFSIIILCIGVITIPYTALVISHEDMNIFAVIGIIEAVLKLLIAFAICISPIDKLIFYGLLLVSVSLFSLISYYFVCRKRYDESKYHLFYDKDIFRQIFSFSAWSMFGQFAIIGANQGTNILVNMFYSVTANAAMGIAAQVNSAISSLAGNIQTAFKPQITKSLAAKNYQYFNSLVFYSTKMAFYILFVVALPLILNIDLVLKIWLGTVPEYTSEFCILFIIASLFNTLGAAPGNSVEATGRIKYYQLVISFAFLSDILIVYLLYKVGYPVITGMVVKVALNFIVIFIRILFAKKEIESFSALKYIKEVLIRILLSIIIVLILIVPFRGYFDNIYLRLLITLLSVFLTCSSAYLIGLNGVEKEKLREYIVSKITPFIHKYGDD